MKKLFVLLVCVFLFSGLFSQNYYRICGDFSIKGKTENSAQLVMGKFYYDKNEKKIIHDNMFPEKARWITSDTTLYQVADNKIVSRQTIPDFTLFSMYHLVLNNQLDNFGLEGSVFSLEKIETEGGQVITTWVPPRGMKKIIGKIMISSKDNNLFGIIFFSVEGEIIKKQFFEDYTLTGGLAFPGRITEIVYKDGIETYQVTTYKNIKVNDHSEEHLYHFNPSAYK